MSSQNPLQESIQIQTESNQTTQSQKPVSSSEKSQESKKSKPQHESPEKPHVIKAVAGEEGKRGATAPPPKSDGTVAEEGGRERLKRHRVEIAGRVWIPDMWGQEDLLKDWIDCAAFDASLVSSTILMARDSLAEQGRRANSTRLRIQN